MKRIIGFMFASVLVSLVVPYLFYLEGKTINSNLWSTLLPFAIVSMIAVKLIFKNDYKYYLIYPISLLLVYVPMNIVSGMYVSNGEYRNYSSYPRYEIIPYFILALFLLYSLVGIADYLTKKRFTKPIFIVSDIISLGVVFITLFATTFSSPHG
jgi:hypothetical protein